MTTKAKNNGFKKGTDRTQSVTTKAKRREISKMILDGKYTDPLKYLLEVVHTDGFDIKEKIECAKASVPYLYSKAPVEIEATVKTEISSDEATQSIKDLLLMGKAVVDGDLDIADISDEYSGE